MSSENEPTRSILIRLDENVKAIKDDYMTESKTDLVVLRSIRKHENLKHKAFSTMAFLSTITAIVLLVTAVLSLLPS